MIHTKLGEKYIDDPNRCPRCGTDEIFGNSDWEAEHLSTRRTVECDKCGLKITEHFTMTDVSFDTD